MTIYFSEIFKKLRKNRSMTQEQIAEVLSVSPQAVSRWETGATYPDIALLPAIAEFFETTVDALLGTGKARAQERIQSLLHRGHELCDAGELVEANDLLRSAVREFPNSYELQYALFEVLLKTHEAGNNNSVDEKETAELGERILTYSTDDRIRLLTKVHLGRFYAELGRGVRAAEIFMTLPEAEYCREKQMCLAGLDAGAFSLTADMMPVAAGPLSVDGAVLALFAGMRRASETDAPKERLAEAKRRLQILDEIYAEKDYDGHYWENAAVCSADMAEGYALCGDSSRALLCLSKAVECASEASGTLLSDTLFTDGIVCGTAPRSLSEQMRDDFLSKPCFDGIRQDPSFPKID